ncbi:hypothetical protein JCM19235_20 [Vibrio maritimus]|uniref:DUF3135 domain-containing protein n=1 Tax=Vibrio maritimus TaxID=990268 RepID=A0A090SVT9_9VIBR|nr:hypothetical protein JCM19235_20 [Vibrio maritimus]
MAEPISLPSFEELAAMAKEDPEKLSQLRHQLCEQFIESCSTDMQPRLHAQQSHIERVLQRAKNPIHANVLLREELHKQIVKFSEALQGELPSPKQTADVLPFRRDEEWR